MAYATGTVACLCKPMEKEWAGAGNNLPEPHATTPDLHDVGYVANLGHQLVDGVCSSTLARYAFTSRQRKPYAR